MSEITENISCPCNGKFYKILKVHRKSKAHIHWEQKNEIRDLKIMLTERDNIIKKIEIDNKKLMEMNFFFMDEFKNAPAQGA